MSTAILGLGPADFATWLSNKISPDALSWIASDKARWVFVIGALGLFLRSFYYSRRQTIIPDITINEAIDYIVNDSREKFPPPRVIRIGGILVPARGNWHHSAVTRLNERLASGEFDAFGYKQILPQPGPRLHEDIRRKIEGEYWRVAQLHPLNCFYFTETSPQTFIPQGPQTLPVYYQLMMNKSQILRAFPRKALWRRFRERWISKTKKITYHQ